MRAWGKVYWTLRRSSAAEDNRLRLRDESKQEIGSSTLGKSRGSVKE